jgi:hypothetical protein
MDLCLPRVSALGCSPISTTPVYNAPLVPHQVPKNRHPDGKAGLLQIISIETKQKRADNIGRDKNAASDTKARVS